MDKLEAQSKLPLRMTYRAVGSSAGQREFTNEPSPVHFASGDLPVVASRYAALQAAGIEMVHLPVFLELTSIFHNIPGVLHLNLTADILADIYSFVITDWNDDRIKEHNPNMNIPSSDDTTIVPVRRARGSSSTAAVTEVSLVVGRGSIIYFLADRVPYLT